LVEKKVQRIPDLKHSLQPVAPSDVIELDELWSFVRFKRNVKWIWIALCRRTRQVLAFVVGYRDKSACLKLWNRIPAEYKKCQSYSDFWETYNQVFPDESHQSVGKASGETNHVERWNNTLRQRLARFVRKTLSFSKSLTFHCIVLKIYIWYYNLDHAM
jgi:insertion element IS1 protein InsB